MKDFRGDEHIEMEVLEDSEDETVSAQQAFVKKPGGIPLAGSIPNA